MRKTQMINKDQIAERAFQIWEREGQPHGRDQEHWQKAEAELLESIERMKNTPIKRAARAAAAAKAPAKAEKAPAKAPAKTSRAKSSKAKAKTD